MWNNVSNTAEYGGRTRGDKIVDPKTEAAMKKILKDIKSGAFAKEWVSEYESGMPTLNRLRKEGAKSRIEVVGRSIRKMFR